MFFFLFFFLYWHSTENVCVPIELFKALYNAYISDKRCEESSILKAFQKAQSVSLNYFLSQSTGCTPHCKINLIRISCLSLKGHDNGGVLVNLNNFL